MSSINKFISIAIFAILILIFGLQTFSTKTSDTSKEVVFDSIIARPVKDINTVFEEYVLYLPIGYEVTKNQDSITYIFTKGNNIVLTMDSTIKQTTNEYLSRTEVEYLYKYETTMNSKDIRISVWNSLENPGSLNVYIEIGGKYGLGLIPNNNEIKYNIAEMCDIIKSIEKIE